MHLALIGYGHIAQSLVRLMSEPGGPRPTRITVITRPGRAQAARAALGRRLDYDIVETAEDLVSTAPDFAIECAGHGAVRGAVLPLLRAGVDCVVVSVGALADRALEADLYAAARVGDARLVLPAGPIGGVEALAALALGEDTSVTFRCFKRREATQPAPADGSEAPAHGAPKHVLFHGTARQAALADPRTANLAATLALAGAGFEDTEVTLVADTDAPGNVQAFEMRDPAARVEMRIENMPQPGDAKSSVSTIYSVLREVRSRMEPIPA